MFDKSSGVLGLYEGIPIEILDLPKKDQVLVVKIDIDKYDLDTANKLFFEIKKSLPEEVKLVGIPMGINFEVDEIDNIIKYLEEQKK